MITPEDIRLAGGCTGDWRCKVHPGIASDPGHPIHGCWDHIDIDVELQGAAHLHQALESAIPESWDGEDSWESIAARWIAHMAETHGHDCPGPFCPATAAQSAAEGAIRRMWRQTQPQGDAREFVAGVRRVLIDLADELNIDLDREVTHG